MINFINEVLNAKIESQKYILSSKFLLSLKDSEDERVQISLDELRSKYKW